MCELLDIADPMMRYGIGINGYHYLIEALFYLFLIMIICNIPCFINFRKFDFYGDVGYSATYSVGNMGFSKTMCKHYSFLDKKTEITLECGVG